MGCTSYFCWVTAGQVKLDSNGTTQPGWGSEAHPFCRERGSHFHGKRKKNGLIKDVSATYLAVWFPSYLTYCIPESYPKALQRTSVSRPRQELPRLPLVCLRSERKKKKKCSKVSLLASNAPKLNAFRVYFKMALGTGNFSKFNIQLQEQFKLLQLLQTWWSSCRITWIARISLYMVSLTCHALESS